MRRLLTVLLSSIAILSARPISAQSVASPFVPVGHWSAHAVDRLHALGLAPAGTLRGQRSRTVAEVLAVFEAAADSGDVIGRQHLQRFAGEFTVGEAARALLTHASIAGGAGILDGDVAHGVYSTWGEENWTGAIEREDRTTATGSTALLARFGFAAAGAVASRNPVRDRIDELYGLAQAGPLALWGGRRLQGYGPGTGGIVLNGAAPVDGAGLYLAEPIRLPWLLRYLGPVRADIAVGVMDSNGPVERPWFVMTRGSIEPHPRLGFGVTRAGMIGTAGEDVSVTDVLLFLAGDHTDGSEYDNQIAAVDAWFRPPTGSLPLLVYVEWGAEDSAGSWWDVPGIVAGVEIAAVPGLPWLSLVAEGAHFTGSNSGNPPWYRHPIGFHDGWSSRGVLLGHPLGGHGSEWLLQGRASLMEGRLQLVTRGFTRDRGAENVYAPQRAGRSSGFAMEGDFRLSSALALQVRATVESGSGWRRTHAAGTVQLFLPRAQR